MKSIFTFFLCNCMAFIFGQPGHIPIAVESGVSFDLALHRQSIISNIQYDISFRIPADKDSSIVAAETVNFDVKSVENTLQMDWKGAAASIHSMVVNGKPAIVTLQQEHLLIQAAEIHAGRNEVTIQFTVGNASLNRNSDYLYALFVPDHARTVFPCFDQPDLKARFLLTLQVPAGWQVLANAAIKDSVTEGSQTTFYFNNSDLLSTYLFSFTAGKYARAMKQVGNHMAELLYRETDTGKIRLSLDSVFVIHQNAIAFLERYTGIAFPFQKIGFVAIPDFQFGGMEHPGEVQYKASSLFLDAGATRDQSIARISLISHETAHMWFGDLVTMRWFNDVWMKEVFANFMADKVAESIMGTETFNLKFLQDHYPAAYSIDRTDGANPIRQQLDNLQDAGSMYGNIIYHKAPIMMRQLELLMGKENFQAGLQEYLKKYAYSNADWPELIAILSKHTSADLNHWNSIWVNEAGRPVISSSIAYHGNVISHFVLHQQAEKGGKNVWPQRFSITLVYHGHQQTIPVNMVDATLDITAAIGLKKPVYILYNSDGLGYGLFPIDKTLLTFLFTIESPLQRATAYINLYEKMLSANSVQPDELLRLYSRGLTDEQNELNLRLLTGYIGSIYWTFLSPAKRKTFTQKLEEEIWQAMQQQKASNNKKILFKAYQEIYGTAAASNRLYQIWQQQKPPVGITLTEEDYTALALSIALKSDTAKSVLQQQQERIKNIDRKKRLSFIAPALSSDSLVRDQFFYSLQQRSNREKEAWVIAALQYLHHPLRQSTSQKYLPESLSLLIEIKQTGDIFFPQSWLGATLGNYQSTQAVQIVKNFLQQHPDYNPKLKDKILQAADVLFRAEKLVK